MTKKLWSFLMEMKKNNLTFENYELCPSLNALSSEEKVILNEYARSIVLGNEAGNEWV
ncbi:MULTISPECIES: hypothetical protein [Priestia]|jgi:hypothetical protein|uniref:hypothetical protein n=1 Tax=Priestia TaxID=2800373 RepID=UPI002ACEB068|nr:hypothetical protein [Priestia megaterium]